MKRKKLLALSARAVRVARVLAGGSETTWYGEDQIMEATGLCRSTVRRALKDLTPSTMSRCLQKGGRGRPPLIYALTPAARKAFYVLTSAGRRDLSLPAAAELQARWRETWPELEAYFKGRPSPVEAPRG